MMKKIYLLITKIVFFSAISWGQTTLVEAEYFWNTDPGEGNGIAFSALDGNFNATIESLVQNNINVPASGLHTFNVRLKDSNNQWGPIFTQVIEVNNNSLGANAIVNVAEAEYFWDADPGEGNGTPMNATDGNFDTSIEALIKQNIMIAQPSGLHTFNVRMKDSNNEWGPIFTQVIDIETTLSVESNSLDVSLLIYPNPVSNYVSLQKSDALQIQRMNIYDVKGNLVKSITNKMFEQTKNIDISTLSKATYLVVIESSKGSIVKKIIKK